MFGFFSPFGDFVEENKRLRACLLLERMLIELDDGIVFPDTTFLLYIKGLLGARAKGPETQLSECPYKAK